MSLISPLTMGNQGCNDNTPQAALGGANLTSNVVFNKPDISLLKYLKYLNSGNLTGNANFHGQGYSWHEPLAPRFGGQRAGTHMSLVIVLPRATKPNCTQPFYYLITLLGCQESLFTLSSHSTWRSKVSGGRKEVDSNL